MWFMTRASSPWLLKAMMWKALASGTWKIMDTQASTGQPAPVGWIWDFPHSFHTPGAQQGSTDEIPSLCGRKWNSQNVFGAKVFWGLCGNDQILGLWEWPSFGVVDVALWASQQEFLCRNRAGGVTEALKPNKVQGWGQVGRTTIWAEFDHFLLKPLHSWTQPFQLLPLHKEFCWRKAPCGKFPFPVLLLVLYIMSYNLLSLRAVFSAHRSYLALISYLVNHKQWINEQ